MNKTILITGASSGIGKALALQWAQPNYTLLLAARNKQNLEDVKRECENKGAVVHLFQADLASMEQVDLLATQIKQLCPHLDILVNNAGISQRSQAEETAEKVDRSIMELNFFSPVRLTKNLWPLLTKSTHANIVNISSVTGTFGFPQRSAYAASKHAMEGFFESWMLENKAPNIHFTIVAPGRILTNISYNALKSDGTKHELLDEGQAKGIKAEVCAAKIVSAVAKNKRKVYIVQQELILLFLYRYFPSAFVLLVKKLGLK
ncbi:MAG: SDR family NAD(P)-dependent oxidoreductase [Bacteroidia bacterium]|jgi:short-subunit dehydrogenase|nr:SDR family NAD(P)-dependent oxidoreductase [Bacteroidia bacterium]